jgi:hypothetical protein
LINDSKENGMSSKLEIRLCELKKRVVGGVEDHGFGHIVSNANTNAVINGIATLQFNGAAISSDTTNLSQTVQLATGGGFPSAVEIIVIGAADGLSTADASLAAEQALAVKDFLLTNGVPAKSVAVELPLAHAPVQRDSQAAAVVA